MRSGPAQPKKGFNAGWILVTGLLSLCVLGTWLTVHNYRENVFSTAHGTVLTNGWPESRVAADFPHDVARRILPGQIANITMTGSKAAMPGVVIALDASADTGRVIIRLTGSSSDAGQPGSALGIPGEACSVSIDSTIPRLSPEEVFGSPSHSPSPR